MHGRASGTVLVEAWCTPPNWPFQRKIRMRSGRDFEKLTRRKGDPTKHLNVDPLLEQAIYFDNQDWLQRQASRK